MVSSVKQSAVAHSATCPESRVRSDEASSPVSRASASWRRPAAMVRRASVTASSEREDGCGEAGAEREEPGGDGGESNYT